VLEPRSVPGAALELAERLRALARDCGCTPEATAWRPHLTLARRVPAAAAQRPGWPLVPEPRSALRLAAQQFYLVHSQPPPPEAPRYRRVRGWPLRQPPA
jgi:2'-5' RNA ligase